jgi:primosomal protein N' (replication factor Y)
MKARYADVLVDIPSRRLNQTFEYLIPDGVSLQLGSLVLVPFGRTRQLGYVIAKKSQPSYKEHREIVTIFDEYPLLEPSQIELANWLAQRYLASWSEALRLFLPPGSRMKLKEKIVWSGKVKRFRSQQRRSFLELLQQKNSLRYSQVKKKFGPRASALVNFFEKEGLVKRELAIERPSFKPRGERWVRLKKKPSELSPTEAAVLDLVKEVQECPLNELVAQGFSKGILKKLIEKEALELFEKPLFKEVVAEFIEEKAPVWLSAEQREAVQAITECLQNGSSQTFLLQGITGSGKTEVYLRVIEKALKLGKSAIVVVPEIALTPQLAGRFRLRFGSLVTVLHSNLTTRERQSQWWGLKEGRYRIVVGARSAIFAPVKSLGVVVVDEEHETSYKQNQSPRYHTRVVAEKRAQLEGGVLVLGSATPSLETRYQVEVGNYERLVLSKRFGFGKLPTVEVVDLKTQKGVVLSERLIELMKETFEKDEKVLLFLNRRGFAPFLLCGDCGQALYCPNCAVSLVYHAHSKQVVCHHCGYEKKAPRLCPYCRSFHLLYKGSGTERVEDEVKRHFPNVPVVRVDRDTVRQRGMHRTQLLRFANLKKSVLLGTQMIAKGLDFPDVTLVGIINADVALHLPDFRAAEQTFQLLMQAGGRAGRGSQPGRVVIQTYSPNSPVISSVIKGDYEEFYRGELEARRELSYPPFSFLVNIIFSSREKTLASKKATELSQALSELPAEFLGPAPAPLERLRGFYRWHLTLKFPSEGVFNEHRETLSASLATFESSACRIVVDVDPTWLV